MKVFPDNLKNKTPEEMEKYIQYMVERIELMARQYDIKIEAMQKEIDKLKSNT